MEEQARETRPFEVFFDGDCPLCMREIRFLRGRDAHGRIRFTDIAANDFDATGVGRTRDELMARIHGRMPDGTWIEGVEVFRQLYARAGLGGLAKLSRLPVVAQLADAAYAVFARNRLRLTGRCEGDLCTTPRSV